MSTRAATSTAHKIVDWEGEMLADLHNGSWDDRLVGTYQVQGDAFLVTVRGGARCAPVGYLDHTSVLYSPACARGPALPRLQ